jgi:hypothetical protein
MAITTAGYAVANELWERYNYALQRGHREYTLQAMLCERHYLGGGRQWDEDEAAGLLGQRRVPYEFNDILPSINAAVGYQIHNRMDIKFRPRGGKADQTQAEIRSKVVMQIANRQHLDWKETEVFSDGMIQQRGYFDVRMAFDRNMQGDIVVKVPDPMDVIPDPDGKTYEPDGWADVITTRWLTEEETEREYGREVAAAAWAHRPSESDFGEYDDSGARRARFGQFYDSYYSDGRVTRARIVERQSWHTDNFKALYYPESGDIKLAENLSPIVLQQQLAQGAVQTKFRQRRVKWQAATCNVTLHDEWSPYDTFSIVPFFAFFRRGQTIGLIDNAIGPQQARNKAFSSMQHILGSTANGGWMREENSVTNMDDDQFRRQSAMTGLDIVVKKGTPPANWPQKIQPNRVPEGIDRYIELVTNALKSVTVPDAMRGVDGMDTSGIARQTQQFAAQQQIAVPIDNLKRTRHLLAEKFNALVQQYYTEARIFRITELDFATGLMKETPIEVNKWDEESSTYINDLTEGDYDVIVDDQPSAVTLDSGQFDHALAMRKEGIAVPDAVVVQVSSMNHKAEIIQEMKANAGQTDPLMDAKKNLLIAQAQKVVAEAVSKAVESMFSATQAANQIAAVPAVAPLADALLLSAGFQDANAPPIVPAAPPGVVPAQLPTNTNPLTPTNPAVGMDAGIERADPSVGVPA